MWRNTHAPVFSPNLHLHFSERVHQSTCIGHGEASIARRRSRFRMTRRPRAFRPLAISFAKSIRGLQYALSKSQQHIQSSTEGDHTVTRSKRSGIGRSSTSESAPLPAPARRPGYANHNSRKPPDVPRVRSGKGSDPCVLSIHL